MDIAMVYIPPFPLPSPPTAPAPATPSARLRLSPSSSLSHPSSTPPSSSSLPLPPSPRQPTAANQQQQQQQPGSSPPGRFASLLASLRGPSLAQAPVSPPPPPQPHMMPPPPLSRPGRQRSASAAGSGAPAVPTSPGVLGMINTPPAPQPPSPAREIGNPFSYLRGRRGTGNQQQQQQQQQGSGAAAPGATIAGGPAGGPAGASGAPPQTPANSHPGGQGQAPAPSVLTTTTSPGPISPVSTASHHHVHLPHLLHRRHSTTAPSPPALSPPASNNSSNSANATPLPSATPTAHPGATAGANTPMPIGAQHGPPGTPGNPHRLRLVPHLESSRSLIFDPILRQLLDGQPPIRIGRFTERRSTHGGRDDDGKIAFRSKVVSRGHAEVWCEPGGKVLLRDTSSSSGTFLNHIRLSSPNIESRPYPLKDGDVIQLGVDYQGGTEEIYRCVKIRVELDRHVGGREAFNENALAQLNALAATTAAAAAAAAAGDAPATIASATGDGLAPGTKKASITECSICISSVTVCQALFIAPCSHVFHYKCIRPLVEKRYPGFMCPMCRCYADLDADVDDEEYGMPTPKAAPVSTAVAVSAVQPAVAQVQADAAPAAAAPVIEIEDQDMDEVAVENEALGNGGMDEDEEDNDVIANLSEGSPETQEEEEDEDLIEEREVEATASNASIGASSSGSANPPSSFAIPMAGPSRAHPEARQTDRERLDDNATPMNNLFLSTLADTSVRRSRVANMNGTLERPFGTGTVLTPIPSVSSIAPSFIARGGEEASPAQARNGGSQRRKGKRRAPISSDDVTEREGQESTRKPARERRALELEDEDDEDEDAVMVEG